ncbi:hypothetical protein E2320_014426, partial [Naja naja]
ARGAVANWGPFVEAEPKRRSAGRGRWGQEPRLLCGSAINPSARPAGSKKERKKARRSRRAGSPQKGKKAHNPADGLLCPAPLSRAGTAGCQRGRAAAGIGRKELPLQIERGQHSVFCNLEAKQLLAWDSSLPIQRRKCVLGFNPKFERSGGKAV